MYLKGIIGGAENIAEQENLYTGYYYDRFEAAARKTEKVRWQQGC